MTEHLRPEEFVDVLDNVAPAAVRDHVRTCPECRAQLNELRDMVRESAGVDAPAPSPLFWEHFSDRVREATTTLPTRAPWWEGIWRPAAVVVAAAAVILAVALRPHPAEPIGVGVQPADETSMAKLELPDDGTWGLVVAIASDYKYADVKEATEPVSGTADAMIDELTPAQCAALARLLDKEMGNQ